mgnify:CR=1 FL=1
MLSAKERNSAVVYTLQAGLDKIQAELGDKPFAINLIHSPFDETLEQGNVELFLKRGVRIVEASAFMKLTLNIVRYRVAGLEKCPSSGKTICRNKVIFKVSRTELAGMALRPAPAAPFCHVSKTFLELFEHSSWRLLT